jgi:hypothetical protein
MVSFALPFPQGQTYLALVPLASGLAGVPRRARRPATGHARGSRRRVRRLRVHLHLPRPEPPLLLASPHPHTRALDRDPRRVSRGAARATGSSSCHSLRVVRARRPRRRLQGPRRGYSRKHRRARSPSTSGSEGSQGTRRGRCTSTCDSGARSRTGVGWSGATGTRSRRHRTYPSPAIPSPRGSIPRR